MLNTSLLPFTKRNTNGTVDAWAPQGTGNYADDCALGNNYFDAARFHAESENPLIISHILQAMIAKGSVTGVEVGFLHSLTMGIADSQPALAAE